MREPRLVAPSNLGYGINVDGFRRAMEHDPHLIGIDAGSTDIGPYYLGSRQPFYSHLAVKKDLALTLPAAIEHGLSFKMALVQSEISRDELRRRLREGPIAPLGTCMTARGILQHCYFPGQLANSGNMAYPFTPFVVPAGEVYRFHIEHLLPLADPCELFPVHYEQVDARAPALA